MGFFNKRNSVRFFVMRGMVSKTSTGQHAHSEFVDYTDDAVFLTKYPDYAEKPMSTLAEIHQDKIYLDFSQYLLLNGNRHLVLQSRHDIVQLLGSQYMYLNKQNVYFHVHQIFAEPRDSGTGAGIVIGCVIGLLFGPAGMLIGAAFAVLEISMQNNNSRACARTFNQSKVELKL